MLGLSAPCLPLPQLKPGHFPGSVPSDVCSWWSTTGSDLFKTSQPKTVTVPQDVYTWWTSVSDDFVGPTVSVVESSIIAAQPSATTSTTAPVTTTPVSSQPASPASAASNPASSTGGSSSTEVSTSSSSTATISPPPPPPSTTSSSSKTADTDTTPGSMAEGSSASGSPTDSPGSLPPPSTSPSTGPPTSIAATSTKSHNKTTPIVVGVVVPLVLILLGIAAFVLYKRRQRARDRREWERTHEDIAEAVRQVGAPAAATAWNRGHGDVKVPPDGDTAPLFNKSGGSPPGSLGHGSSEMLHSQEPSSLI